MCGICGIIPSKKNTNKPDEILTIVKSMLSSIRHRGPDGQNVIALDRGEVCFGHCRLSIIDLSESANQPIQDISGRYTIIFNGEIYNYRELRDELRASGYCFKTNSDTEVLLTSYIHWGTKALSRLNGVFAFAIWDDEKKEAIIVRDRYGTRPLYYTMVDNMFLFSSEYKAFYSYSNFKPELDLFAVKEYFTFQNIFSNRSFIKNVKILMPGHYVIIKPFEEFIPHPVLYWDYNFEENCNITEKECEEELNRLFYQAVKRQLVSDVEVGAYLSGGIDSGAITAVASKAIPGIKSFTCGMDLHSASGIELGYDERESAEYLSYLYGTELYEMILKAGDMERCMSHLVWHIEDPRVGQSYPNYYAAKLASNFVKVVLAGTGGDELFAGYPWRYYVAINSDSFEEYLNGYYNYWQRLLDDKAQQDFLGPIWNEIKDYSTLEVFKDIFSHLEKQEMTPQRNVNYSLYLEAKTFLHGLMVIEDKISMAHGMETRVPFLDNDLVDFAMKLPVNYKLRNLRHKKRQDENSVGPKVDNYYEINRDGKMMLRNVMSRYLPDEISKGKKQGFSSPDASWFRGESMNYVNDVISAPNARMYTFLDRNEVRKCFNEHIEGKKNNRLLIWSILNFEKYIELFL